MRKQYMDFVPAGGVKLATARGGTLATRSAAGGAAKVAARGSAAKTAVKASRSTSAAKAPVKTATTRTASMGAARASVRKTASAGAARRASIATAPATPRKAVAKSVNAGNFSTEKKLGAVETVSPKFVKTDVPKRPLSRGGHFVTAKTGVAAAKAQKIGGRGASVAKAKPVEKPVENSKRMGVYQTPQNPFINQGKVAKRPLSKNIYVKKVETPKEEPQGPVTIISQPEKQAHVGMVVTIILTIILGAAAGTVAFLLLPK